MEASKKIIDFIKSYEELKQIPYQDGAKIWTIGWGHVISDDKLDLFKTNINANNGILPLSQCQVLFNNDLKPKINYMNNICKTYDLVLEQNVFDAFISFIFNTGEFNTEMLERFANKDFNAIFSHMLLYIHDAQGNIEEGLVKRRKDEVNIATKNIYEKT